MNKDHIRTIKQMIQYGDVWGLKEYWNDLDNNSKEYENYAYLFRVFFTHACLYNQLECAKWLYTLWEQFNEVTQIALRQMFNYCHHLSQKHKDKRLANWIKEIIIENKIKFSVVG